MHMVAESSARGFSIYLEWLVIPSCSLIPVIPRYECNVSSPVSQFFCFPAPIQSVHLFDHTASHSRMLLLGAASALFSQFSHCSWQCLHLRGLDSPLQKVAAAKCYPWRCQLSLNGKWDLTSTSSRKAGPSMYKRDAKIKRGNSWNANSETRCPEPSFPVPRKISFLKLPRLIIVSSLYEGKESFLKWSQRSAVLIGWQRDLNSGLKHGP